MTSSFEVDHSRPRVLSTHSSSQSSSITLMGSSASIGTPHIQSTSPDGITQAQASLSLMTCIIGAGIMALPQLPMRGGWVLSTIIMCLCCSAIAVSGVDGIWRAFRSYNDKKAMGEKLISFEDLGRKALGRQGEILVFITITVYFLGCLAGYIILIAQQLEAMAKTFNHQISQQAWTCILFIPFLCLSYLRDMTAIAKVVPIGVAGAFLSCGLICAKAVYDSGTWKDWGEADLQGKEIHQMWPESPMSLGVVIGTLFGAFGVNANVPSVLSEMKNPDEFPCAFRTAVAVVLVLYLLIMLLGHYGYGNYVQENILISMSRAPSDAAEAFATSEDGHLRWCFWTGPCGWVVSFAMQVSVLANLIISFPLNLMAVIQSFQTTDGIADKVPLGTFRNYMLRTSLVGVIFGIALAIPSFGTVFALFASLCGPLLQTVYPIYFGFLVERMAPGSPTRLSGIKIAILILAFLCIIIGVVDSVHSLILSFQTSIDECKKDFGRCSIDGMRYYLNDG